MVKERSYKILEQLDEYELQEPGESSMAVYHSDSEDQLTREHRINVAPSAMDSDNDDESDSEEYSEAHDSVSQQHVSAANADSTSNTAATQQNSALTASSSAAVGSTVPNPTDGVFANMSAKPDLYLGYDDKVPNEPLPTYQDIYGPQSSSAPPYFETAVISVGDEDELLIEGLPVGSMGVFMVNMVVSTAFQVVGYMLTFLLHSSHAAKNGSLAGLGITFMNFGFYIRTHLGQGAFDDGNEKGNGPAPPGSDGQYDSDTPLDNAYFAYLLMVIGAVILIKALFDYARVRRLQIIIESSPEQNV
ncbi:hypothetical protein GGI25_003491 [Coemansia spiralis]|uniref:Metal homeostatis protein bsd2 n=2 Tax=Coemansia TaxID=4863 RepID=A0A9W8G835_9FUNG|nr:hypothetical protein BX070DRAFT_235441 [Coemansia spiralis]KAJ1991508.1 hypothetical protein EDC05_003432 [Coemansia umbellata]KAJ2621537.1 hypothetical protein GGI26_004000 [Coemansia sp. RSA 1358]KAJ2676739.1 hypothetical protein GGI25_003491 [Coemansia spiralis]